MFSSWSILHSHRCLQYVFAVIMRNRVWRCCFGAVNSHLFSAFPLKILENLKWLVFFFIKLPFQAIIHISCESGFCGQMSTREVDSNFLLFRLLSWSDYCQNKVRKKKDDKPLTDKLSHCSPLCCLKDFVAFGKSRAQGCLCSWSFYLIWLSWYVSVRDQTAHLLDIKAICRALPPPQDITLMRWACAFHWEARKAPQQPNEIIQSAWKKTKKTAPSVEGGMTGVFDMLSHAHKVTHKCKLTYMCHL